MVYVKGFGETYLLILNSKLRKIGKVFAPSMPKWLSFSKRNSSLASHCKLKKTNNLLRELYQKHLVHWLSRVTKCSLIFLCCNFAQEINQKSILLCACFLVVIFVTEAVATTTEYLKCFLRWICFKKYRVVQRFCQCHAVLNI